MKIFSGKSNIELSEKIANLVGVPLGKIDLETFSDGEFFFDYGKKEIKDKRKMGHLTILKK